MRHSLLKMTQLILSSMNSDEVNSIGDTSESLQVVDAIETSYWHLAETLDFPDYWDFFELTPSNDPSLPTVMYLPPNVGKLEYIQYNRSDNNDQLNYHTVHAMDRKTFSDRMNSLDKNSSIVYNSTISSSNGTLELVGHNNRPPNYYTTYDDNTILFDSYDRLMDTTLQGNKTRCYGMLIPSFIREDDFVPELDPRQFSLLLNEAKSQAFIDIKEVENPKAEQRARKGWVQAHRKVAKMKAGEINSSWTPDYGRKR